jgi:hypothetical protein
VTHDGRPLTARPTWPSRYVKKFFVAAPDLVTAQPQILYIDTPHDGFGPMGEIQPR